MRRFQEGTKSEKTRAVHVGATVFRADGSAATVTIVDLTFDGCQVLSAKMFVAGERLRIYQIGQGCIEAEVERTSDGRAELRFLTDCQV